ncbi:MAG: hypothetical protein H0U23_10845, partial [Blastocatellia bacterium]|nr:hypothetical protein [Blastocatellia bacterium]
MQLFFGFLLLLPFCLHAAESSLTIYNDDFAVVRETIPLDLKAGVNDVRYSGTTAFVEPPSVILREPSGKLPFSILEQNYRANPVNQDSMLRTFEGQVIDFQYEEDRKFKIVPGRVVRSGRTAEGTGRKTVQPVIEVGGKLRFELPGVPLFPKLGDESVLKPELHWKVKVPAAAAFNGEVAYLTKNIRWLADYNAISHDNSNVVDLVGWVTIDNSSGKHFEDVRTKLVSGFVNKLEPRQDLVPSEATERVIVTGSNIPNAVEIVPFQDYYIYSLPQPITLRDQETKQVEFLRAEGIKAKRLYIYGYNYGGLEDESLLRVTEPKLEAGPDAIPAEGLSIVRELANSKENKLGLPVPKGRWRFYRQGSDGQLEFMGENDGKATPEGETIRVFTGLALDVLGEKRRLEFTSDLEKRVAEEAIEIKLRN